jgi:hypothetical protein
MHKIIHALPAAERTVWILDDVWPETASMVAEMFGPNDQMLAPGVWRGFPNRYDWPVRGDTPAKVATIGRHLAMRRVASAPGGVRQRAYLEQDARLARQLAKAIDYRARHLVVAQSWLPWLDEAGALGGRTFDVVMSRYPLGEVHRLLDEAAAEIGPSSTIADFRADPQLAEREAELLARARRIITPHHGIASLFPGRTLLLAWHRPPPTLRKPGSRVAFLGPTIARQRPDVARAVASSLSELLIVFGPVIEPLWEGVTVERRTMGPGWLDGIGTILHPASLTNQPRALLEALVSGVRVYASETCGLPSSDYAPLDSFNRPTAAPRARRGQAYRAKVRPAA